jgi:hypothetical protein
MRGRSQLAYKLLLFAGTLIVGAMLIAVLNPAFDAVMGSYQNQTSTQAASTGGQWIQAAWDATPFLVAGLGVVMLIAAAAFEGQR